MSCALDWEKLAKIGSALSNFKWVLTPNFWAAYFKILEATSGGSRISPRWGHQLHMWMWKAIIWPFFPKYFMKLKEFEPRKGRQSPSLGYANRLPSMNRGLPSHYKHCFIESEVYSVKLPRECAVVQVLLWLTRDGAIGCYWFCGYPLQLHFTVDGFEPMELKLGSSNRVFSPF